MKTFNFILLGRSGSGKGTQAKLLMDKYSYLYFLSTGDLFRDLLKQKTDVGMKVKKMVEAGELPMSEIAVTLWMYDIFYKVRQDQGIVFEGSPRRLEEAKDLDKLFDFLERKDNTFCILVDISKQEAFNRLTKRRVCKKCSTVIPYYVKGNFKELKKCHECGGELVVRKDDNEESIENRMEYFEQSVVPVIKYYEKQGRLIRINGEQSIQDVFKDILKAIDDKDKD